MILIDALEELRRRTLADDRVVVIGAGGQKPIEYVDDPPMFHYVGNVLYVPIQFDGRRLCTGGWEIVPRDAYQGAERWTSRTTDTPA